MCNFIKVPEVYNKITKTIFLRRKLDGKSSDHCNLVVKRVASSVSNFRFLSERIPDSNFLSQNYKPPRTNEGKKS